CGADARGLDVAEAVRVADVFDTNRVANAADDALAARHVRVPTGQVGLIPALRRLGERKRGAAAHDLGDRCAAHERLTGDDRIPVDQAVPRAYLHGAQAA